MLLQLLFGYLILDLKGNHIYFFLNRNKNKAEYFDDKHDNQNEIVNYKC